MSTSIHRSVVPTPAPTRPKSSGGARFRRVAVSLAALVAPVAVLASAGEAAEAYTAYQPTGSAGIAGVRLPVEGHSSYAGAAVVIPWMYATESLAYKSSWQYVCATYKLWRQGPAFNGAPSWNLYGSRQNCSWIAPAQDVAYLDGAQFSVSPFATYEVSFELTWRLAPGGNPVGTRLLDFVDWYDYVCKTPAPGCSATGKLTFN